MIDQYDVVIPVGAKDVSFAVRVVEHVHRFFHEADKVYLVTNGNFIPQLERMLEKKALLKDCVVLDENRLLEGLTFGAVKQLLAGREGVSVGWYFQQFLKLGFACTGYARQYYLTWDADTLPLKPISFFEDGHPMFTRKKEYNEPYFLTIKYLLGLSKENDFSFIAEHMMFKTEIVRSLLDTIDNTDFAGKSWYEKIIQACDRSSPFAFSEFETYGTFVMNTYPGLYRVRHLDTFRCGGFIQGRNITEEKLEEIAFDTDTISFEYRHEPLFPYNLLCKFQLFLLVVVKLKKYSLKDLIKKIF